MKKQLTYLGVVLGVLSLWSCDTVDLPLPEPEQIDPSEVIPFIDTAAMNDTVRVLLAEEFTGHQCTFCPAETKKLVELTDNNAGRMIMVSLHAGQFARVDDKYPTEFRTEYSTTLNDLYQVIAYPSAMASRLTIGNERVFATHTLWKDPIEQNLGRTPKISMGMAANYITAENKVNLRVSARADSNIANQHKVIVLCVEDSVVAPQKDETSSFPDKRVVDYNHRHVVRDKINGGNEFGETLFDILNEGEWAESIVSTTLPESIVDINKVTLVAYILDGDNEEVIQAIEIRPTILP